MSRQGSERRARGAEQKRLDPQEYVAPIFIDRFGRAALNYGTGFLLGPESGGLELSMPYASIRITEGQTPVNAGSISTFTEDPTTVVSLAEFRQTQGGFFDETASGDGVLVPRGRYAIRLCGTVQNGSNSSQCAYRAGLTGDGVALVQSTSNIRVPEQGADATNETDRVGFSLSTAEVFAKTTLLRVHYAEAFSNTEGLIRNSFLEIEWKGSV